MANTSKTCLVDDKTRIGLAGEYRVLSELLKRGYNASLTMGNTKATDIIVFNDKRSFIRIEVKTSRSNKFVTGYYPKYTDPSALHPDIWVLYLPNLSEKSNGDRFFILTHEEVGKLQLEVNGGNKTEKGKGCDNIPLKQFKGIEADFEDRWGKIKTGLDNVYGSLENG